MKESESNKANEKPARKNLRGVLFNGWKWELAQTKKPALEKKGRKQ